MKSPSGLITAIILLLTVLLSFSNLGFLSGANMTRGLGNLGIFLTQLFPPNFTILGDVYNALFETVHMAFLGTLIGFVFALPLSVFGARNMFSREIAAAMRVFFGIVRTIPALLWALIFVVTFGLGPIAGTLGLAAYTLGYLGKLYYEAMEAVDPEVIEAVKATGCSRLQLVRFAVIPESTNQILSQLLFMFEYNVRASSILGFVGAGGVGFYMLGYIQVFQYQNLMALIILVLIIVLAIDFLSARIRDRFMLATK